MFELSFGNVHLNKEQQDMSEDLRNRLRKLFKVCEAGAIDNPIGKLRFINILIEASDEDVVDLLYEWHLECGGEIPPAVM
jgi:hypothetical protein